ncbi:MAG: CHAD domain-containing protein [Actinomycetota bacterium]|nr:CHAD domain-containing protein [Actinomycetota bacterium]
MAFGFRAGEEVSAGVRRVAQEQIDGARGGLAGESDHGVDKAIHEARKSFKRLRALMRLVRPSLGKKVYRSENRTFRDCGRRLAGARDAAVLVDTMDALAPDLDLSVTAFARARSALTAEHLSRRDQVVERARAQLHVAATLELAAARVPGWPLDGLEARDLAPGLQRVARTGRQAMAIARDDPSPELLHEWRKRVKYHWHHVELFEAVDPAELVPRAEDVHRLADLLGDDHDLHVLSATLLADPAIFGPTEDLEGLVRLVARRRSSLQHDAFALGRELYGDHARDLVVHLTDGLGRLAGTPTR